MNKFYVIGITDKDILSGTSSKISQILFNLSFTSNITNYISNKEYENLAYEINRKSEYGNQFDTYYSSIIFINEKIIRYFTREINLNIIKIIEENELPEDIHKIQS